ncbi:MAG: hypothetical protein ABIN36_03705, partial [Ferruginibacter sp.]
MINNSPLDDHIKKQFGNYKPEVPPHIWENIIARKEHKKPAGFLFNLRGKRFTILLLLFITTGAGALMVHNFYKNNTDNNSSANQSVDTKTVTKDQNNISGDIKRKITSGTNTHENTATNNLASVPE